MGDPHLFAASPSADGIVTDVAFGHVSDAPTRTTSFAYDDLYRLTKVDYTYVTQSGADDWVDRMLPRSLKIRVPSRAHAAP